MWFIILSSGCRVQISTHKKKTGVLSPKRFINRLKRDNELFRGYMHQVRPKYTF